MLSVDGLTLVPEDVTATIEHRTLTNVPSQGTAWRFEIVGRGIRLVVADIAWDTGERDVRAVEVSRNQDVFGRLLRGGRIGVYDANYEAFPEGLSFLELAVMRLKPNEPHRLPTAVRADYSTLCRAAGGVSVWDVLADLGGSSIGPRAELFGDRSTRQNFLIATFRSDNKLVPVAAFALTRVMPLAGGFAG